MSRPYWVTKAGSLGKVNELEFYDVDLQVIEPTGAPVTFTFQSGELPPGIQVIKSGKLQGVPVVLNPISVSESREYKFTIRASAARTDGTIVVDRSFSITVSNVYPPEITPVVTSLGASFDGKKYELQLDAIEDNPNANLVWKIIDGNLPPGLTLSESGLITGYILLQPALYDTGLKGYDSEDISAKQPYDKFPYDYAGRARSKVYSFTVQVSDGANFDTQTYSLLVVNKGLLTTDQDVVTTVGYTDPENVSLTVDNSYVTVDADNRYVPIITTPQGSLPTIRQDNNFAFKFEAIDFEGDAINWTISLADGSAFDQGGSKTYPENTITEVVWFNDAPTSYSPGGTVSFTVNTAPYSDITNDYNPTVSVTGAVAWWANTHVASLTLGSDFTIAGDSIIVDSDLAQSIYDTGYARIGANILIVPESNPIDSTGIGYDHSLYDQTASKLPPVLSINSETGWLHGVTSPQIETSKTYDFIINAYKKDSPSYISDNMLYSITILGATYDEVTWITPSALGSINNGGISEFKVEATSKLGTDIVYTLESGAFQRFPQGLQLLSDGLISGRVTFRHFSLDNGNTTFDKNQTFFDNLYVFTIRASTIDGSASSTRIFTININNLYKAPYENLYLKAFPTQDQRQLFNSIIGNEEIFPSSLMYRNDDPWWGRARDIRFLEVAGLTASTLEEYCNAIQLNHQWKRINFGEIKTAIATDEFYNTKYEVVYVDVLDPMDQTNLNVREQVTLTDNPYKENGVDYNILYPNTLENMDYRLSNGIGYTARGLLPDWMTSVQPNKTVLGFTRAIVLAYTVPGASKLIAYRLKNSGVEFNLIDFVADRYDLDNNLSQYFDPTTDTFIAGKETTFDHLIIGVGSLEGGTVDYALSQPFDSVNSRTINFINENNGLDGVTGFKDGDTLIFAQQENYFNNTGPNDGWNDYRDAWLGNDLTDSNTEGYYDTDRYDDYSIIPGWNEKQQNIINTLLIGTVPSGSDILYVAYTVGVDYVGKSVSAFSGILPNTFVLAQELDTVGGNTVLKLTINNPATLEITIGSTVTFRSSFQTVGNSTGYTLATGVIPVDLSIGCQLFGVGVPDNTIITNIVGTTITVNNVLGSSVTSGAVVSYSLTNQRAGVWKISINDNIVTLNFVREVQTGEKVKILDGRTYGFSFLVYNPVLEPGQTVPAYSLWTSAAANSANYTVFDKNGTRFFDSRDSYSEPSTGDKYIKFPQIGVFT